MLNNQTLAPNFSLKDQNNKTHELGDFRGVWLLIYFYPRDNTPGCTTEACEIRDNFPQFNELDLAVVGISADSVESHKKFAHKHSLQFPLLSDEDHKVSELYEVYQPKKFMGKEFMGIVRASYLIDPEGKIVKVYEKVKPAEHAREVLGDIKEFRKTFN